MSAESEELRRQELDKSRLWVKNARALSEIVGSLPIPKRIQQKLDDRRIAARKVHEGYLADQSIPFSHIAVIGSNYFLPLAIRLFHINRRETTPDLEKVAENLHLYLARVNRREFAASQKLPTWSKPIQFRVQALFSPGYRAPIIAGNMFGESPTRVAHKILDSIDVDIATFGIPRSRSEELYQSRKGEPFRSAEADPFVYFTQEQIRDPHHVDSRMLEDVSRGFRMKSGSANPRYGRHLAAMVFYTLLSGPLGVTEQDRREFEIKRNKTAGILLDRLNRLPPAHLEQFHLTLEWFIKHTFIHYANWTAKYPVPDQVFDYNKFMKERSVLYLPGRTK
ncbi:MAG TPA: hypothetical protein VJI13_01250 [Candidatus Norongarragalinales archaeon]|nr:hypothetical protein [Candidatus Norongarragalinales archaeon]